MKILVTGAMGQVGQEVTTLLGANHYAVLAYSSQDFDITQAHSIPAVDYVINCAAYTAVDKAEDEPEKAFAVNAMGVENLAQLCKNQNIPLIHLSTDYVFDGHKPTPYLETDDTHPQNIYGASKLAGEAALRAHWEKHIILRVSWIFGRFGNNFVKTISRLATERPQLKIVADQQGCPTGASHIAEVIFTIINHPNLQDSWGTYHYSDAPPTTWFDFAKSFAPASCELIPIRTEEYPLKASRPQNSVMNCAKIKRVFGINQAHWQEALTNLIEEL